MINLCYAALISCEVAALPFQAHVNYGTCLIDFEIDHLITEVIFKDKIINFLEIFSLIVV